MKELFSLGKLYVSDFLKPDEQPRNPPVEMKLMMDDKGRVRLNDVAPMDTMYGKYWYRSGINATMRNELKSIVDSITGIYKLKENDLWIDIACNDGTLLSYVPKDLLRVGIDPADDTFFNESKQHSNLIIQDYFTAETFKRSRFGNLKAKVITSIAMFYDLEHPEKFIQDVHEVLDDDGVWVLQLSYTPLMINQVAFDNIVHEHLYYYSLANLRALLEENGFKVMDCQLNDVNGGSFRVYAMKAGANFNKFGSQAFRDVCDVRNISLEIFEASHDYNEAHRWSTFFLRIEELKKEVRDFIVFREEEGKTVWAYGASTKGNTLLQYFGLDNTLITGIADRSPAKWGLRTVGTNIPITSEEEMRKAKPDYLLVLPWHFINEFMEREKEYLQGGGKFIVPCPKFEVIGL